MDYFKKSLKQVGAIVQNVGAVVAQSTSQGSSFLFKRPPEDELWERFKSVCLIIDQLATAENSNGAEVERAFNESKVRDHIKEMLKLLQADDARWVRSHSVSCDKEIVYPCIDSFLAKHMMRELCSRAMKDHPRGTMAVILATAASLLRYIRYPLLPHQSVHVPLAQLITHAMRISNSSLVSGNSDAFLKYKHKIDYNLVALVSTLWRKLSENPSLLEFFLFVDRRRSISGADGPVSAADCIRRVKSQLDAIGCLIPLMGKANVGSYAKQAILTAVSLKDPRIESFVVMDTNLLDIVITDLCRRYQRVLDALTSRDRLTLQSRSSGAADGAVVGKMTPVRANPLAGAMQRQAVGVGSSSWSGVEEAVAGAEGQSVASTLDAFLRVLRFSSALRDSSVSVDKSSDARIPRKFDSFLVNASMSSDGMNESCSDVHSIRLETEMLFRDIFLGECVRTVLLPSSSEQQVLSVQLLIRLIIQSLTACHVRYGGGTGVKVAQRPISSAYSTPRREGARPVPTGDSIESVSLNEVTANFFLENPEFMSILVSRAGAMSKAVVISTLQLISNLLVSSSFSSAIKCLLSTPWVRSDATSLKPFASSDERGKNLTVESMLQKLIERPLSGSRGGKVGVCLGVRYTAVPSAYVDTALKRLMSRLFSFSKLEDFFDISDETEQQSSHDIDWSGTDPADGSTNESAEFRGGGSLLTVIFKKLSSFLTLKFDEQIALTGIVSHISCLVATVLAVSSLEAEPVVLSRFEILWHINQIIEKLYNDIQGHLQAQLPNHSALVEHVQSVLSGGDSSVQPRRPRELDNPRVLRVVETAVLVEELMFECRSYVIASFALRGQSSLHATSPQRGTSPMTGHPFSSMKSPLTPQMDSPCPLSPLVGQGFEYIEDVEIEEDGQADSVDVALNTSCLSQLDSLLKEMEAGVDELEHEYKNLNTSPDHVGGETVDCTVPDSFD